VRVHRWLAALVTRSRRLTPTPDVGFGSAQTILLLLASIAILVVFVLIEPALERAAVPFRISRFGPCSAQTSSASSRCRDLRELPRVTLYFSRCSSGRRSRPEYFPATAGDGPVIGPLSPRR